MANVDPTGVLSALVSAAVNEVIGLSKSGIHCKEKCNDLEDSLTEASALLGELNRYSGSLRSSHLDTWLKALKTKVEEAKPLVLECQSLQNPILDFPKRITLATKIDQCSKAIHGHLAAASRHLGVELLQRVALKKQKEVPSNVVPREEQHVVPLDEHIFGMEEMLERVVSNLLRSPVSSKWVGVHGVGGVGKTLLAKQVCENHQVKEHFDPVLWLTFGQSCQVEAKQAELANQIRLESRISNETLRRGLAGKRCLMVLDDVWKSGDLLDLFDVVQENGSKIFITTRKLDVLDSRGAIKTKMGLLGKEDSLKLFTVHAYPNQNYAQNQVSKVVMEQVVEKCGGLPLVLKVIGRRMAGKQDWDFVLRKLNDQQLATLDEEQQVLQRLKLGYDALLPLGIQQHFLFFAAFPEDRQIGFWDLFKCWKGEGLVANTAEAVNVLERLKNHALITDEEDSPGGRWLGDKMYRIHDALLALALHILEQEGPKCYFKVGCSNAWDAFTSNYSKISLVGCRLPIGKNRVTVSSTTCMLLDQNYFHLTSLLSLSLFKSLKVLCLSRSGVVTLPHSIGKLKNLQTLDLSWNTSLQSIPDSLGKLTNLSYLDLGNCRTLETFPVDALLKLTNLVYINGENNFAMWTCHRLHHQLFEHKKCLNRRFGLHLDGMFQALTKLEVLIIHTMLAVELPASIGELSNLKELEIRGQTRVTYDGFRCLTNLESVKLQELDLPLSDWDWSRFPRLRTLEVGGLNGECEFKVTSSMENLQTLVIGWNHHLECLPFLTQEMLPMLTSLSLSNCENLTEVLTISQLASLKDLSIWMCPSLKDLPISFLPNLGTLYLSSCDKVTTLNISECPSLRRVKIDSFGMLACVAFGGKFPRLQEIFLEGFENLPDVSLGAMDAFPQLTRLEIESCGIHQLPEWYASFTKLRALNLRHLENLDVIPDGVARLPFLRELDLMGCRKISMLPSADSEDSSFYPSLEYLTLTGTSVSQEHLSQRLLKVLRNGQKLPDNINDFA